MTTVQQDPTRTAALILSYQKDLEALWRRFYRRAMRSALRLIPVHFDLAQRMSGGRRRRFKNGVIERIMGVFEEAEEEEIRSKLRMLVQRYSRMAYIQGAQRNVEKMQHLGIRIHFGLMPRDLEALDVFAERGLRFLGNDIEDMNKEIMRVISKGILQGEGMDVVARGINEAAAGDSRMGLMRARLIAQSEIIQAYGTAALNKYKEAGLTQWEWTSAIDDRTCPACLENDGKKFDIDTPFESHPGCRCTPSPVVPDNIND